MLTSQNPAWSKTSDSFTCFRPFQCFQSNFWVTSSRVRVAATSFRTNLSILPKQRAHPHVNVANKEFFVGRSLRATLRGFLKSLLSTAKRPLRTAQREGSIFTYCRLQNLPTFAFRCGSLRLCLCFLPAAAATSRRTFSTSLHCVFGGFPADFRQNFGVFGEMFGIRFGCRLCAVRH